ncbi:MULTISPECIES: SIR2 family protein [Luteibacter]|uniref:SIR2 family protein n=1 Tax=Luteibacter TaxID=242605 RepID=UPI00055B5E99|nr:MULTISPECIES: SIR2 family protein [unclassified Luteibacter]
MAAFDISVRDTLKLLDGSFEPFAAGVSNGLYAFWLGSGISFGRAPSLLVLVGKVVEFVRSRIDHADPNCKFTITLREILTLASASADELTRSKFDEPFAAWPDRDAIAKRLVNNYSKLLGLTVDGEDMDYLLWNVIDVGATFADPAMIPDVEHLCLAALSLEGAAPEMLSANWDPLIERAVSTLTDGNVALSPTVVARPADLQLPRNKTRLIKFHGCAVKAQGDPGQYRQWLVASHDQVAAFCTQADNQGLVTALTHIVGSKRTLMLGLSAQDANIQGIFNKAANELTWQLGEPPPSYVFSEQELGMDQRSLLKNVYREQITPANLKAVFEAARIQAYAKRLLVALLLDVWSRKLQALALLAPGLLPPAERQHLCDGIAVLRNHLADAALPDLDFIDALLDRFGRACKLLRDGQIERPNVRFEPITNDVVAALSGNPALGALGLREAAVALGLVGMGLNRYDWTVEPETLDRESGVLAVTGKGVATARTKVYLTASAAGAALLRSEGHLIEADSPLLIQSQKLVIPMTRSPRGASGRTGLPKAREVSISALLQTYATADELYEAFRQELAL